MWKRKKISQGELAVVVVGGGYGWSRYILIKKKVNKHLKERKITVVVIEVEVDVVIVVDMVQRRSILG